jgi:SAM-dependent methyltransferase
MQKDPPKKFEVAKKTIGGVAVKEYVADSLALLQTRVTLRGARILEMGGSLPPQFVMDVLGAAAWVCVDDRSSWIQTMGGSRPPGTAVTELERRHLESGWSCFDSSVHDIPELADGTFDLVVSFAALEHIPSVPKLLRRINSLLRPGGSAWLLVGPIWTGYRGHHIFPHDYPGYARETLGLLDRLEPWHHLLVEPMELYEWVKGHWGVNFADVVYSSVYESTRINRMGYSDYQRAIALSGMSVAAFQAWDRAPGLRPHLERVQARFPQQKGFEANGFHVLLQKTSETEVKPPVEALL